MFYQSTGTSDSPSIMFHLIAIALTVTATVANAAVIRKCPVACNCTEMSVAICSTLELERFDVEIFHLKIINPKGVQNIKDLHFYNIGLESVNSIHIENATISDLSRTAFNKLSRLTSLSIVNSDIPHVYANNFVDATNLKSLNMAGTSIKQLESIKSDSIEELNISGCNLKKITDTNFIDLPELNYLNLAKNRISEIDPLAFANLINLEELNLSENKISTLDRNVLQNNTQLVTLDLSNNPIGALDLNVACDLEKLVLKNCMLTDFNSTMSENFDILSYLDLSNNRLETLPRTIFNKMTELEYLDISSNNLTSLDANIFQNNANLKKIILDNNKLETLPKLETSSGYFATYRFSCNDCELKTLAEDTFAYLPSLVMVHLSNNKLDDVSTGVFKHVPNLVELDLSHNNIVKITKDAFANCTSLEKINLTGNSLTEIKYEMFSSNKLLKSLDVSSCKISKIWAMGQLESLNELYIANNQLNAVETKNLKVTPNLKVLDIRNNLLECSQNLREVLTWLTRHGVVPGTEAASMKTHDSLLDSELDKYLTKPIWRSLAIEVCGGDDDDDEDDDEEEDMLLDNYDDDEEIINTFSTKPLVNNQITAVDESADSEEYDYNYDDVMDEVENEGKEKSKPKLQFFETNTEIDVETLADPRAVHEHTGRYSFLWPTLVFIFTALSVLIIAANVILLVMGTRGAINIPRNVNLANFKILQWGAATKIKTHSGSVYQPLSEDISGPKTPMINRYEKVPNDTPSVHNPAF